MKFQYTILYVLAYLCFFMSFFIFIFILFFMTFQIHVVKLIYESIESVLFLHLQVQGGERFRWALIHLLHLVQLSLQEHRF